MAKSKDKIEQLTTVIIKKEGGRHTASMEGLTKLSPQSLLKQKKGKQTGGGDNK